MKKYYVCYDIRSTHLGGGGLVAAGGAECTADEGLTMEQIQIWRREIGKSGPAHGLVQITMIQELDG